MTRRSSFRLGAGRALRSRDPTSDLLAGLAVSALLVPHGMAYAELAGLPAVTGLYATVATLVGYAVIGPSPTLMVGPDSSLAPLIAAAIVLVGAEADPDEAIAVAGVLSLLTGGICVIAGLARVGTLAELLSRPVRIGYLNGLAVVMIVSQMPKLLGVSGVDATSTVGTALDTVRGAADGGVHGTTTLLGLACVPILLGCRGRAVSWGVLAAVTGATVAVGVGDLDQQGVAVVGAVERGFPRPSLPGIGAGDLATLIGPAFGLALLTLSDTAALSQSVATRRGERVDPSDEIVAVGAANLLAGAFRGFPVSASTTRTTVVTSSGGTSQLAGLVGAGVVFGVLVFGAGLVENIPSTALAALVIAAALRLFDLASLRWLASVRPTELGLSLAASIGVVVAGVLEGIVIAAALSLGNFVRRVWRPYDAVLARVDGRKGYHDLSRHPEARQIPGLLIFRFDAPLFFANADHFRRRVDAVIADAPAPPRRLLLTAEPMSDIDTTGADALDQLLDDLTGRGIELHIAELKGPVLDRARRYGLIDRLGDDHLHSTIGSGIDAYLEDHPDVEWVDWTETREQR